MATAFAALEGGILGFSLEGPMTLDGLKAAGAEIAETCLRKGCTRALADACRQSGDLTILEWHALATSFEGSWPAGLRLAVLDIPERIKPDRFMEATARNRGIDVRVFTERDAALAWLRPRGGD